MTLSSSVLVPVPPCSPSSSSSCSSSPRDAPCPSPCQAPPVLLLSRRGQPRKERRCPGSPGIGPLIPLCWEQLSWVWDCWQSAGRDGPAPPHSPSLPRDRDDLPRDVVQGTQRPLFPEVLQRLNGDGSTGNCAGALSCSGQPWKTSSGVVIETQDSGQCSCGGLQGMDAVGVCVGPRAGLRNVCRLGVPGEWGAWPGLCAGEVGL